MENIWMHIFGHILICHYVRNKEEMARRHGRRVLEYG